MRFSSVPVRSRPTRGSRGLLRVLLPLLAAATLVGACDRDSPTSPGQREVLTLDVRVHLLESDRSDALSTTLSEEEVARLFDSVNDVWSQAGIEWRIESVVREEARNTESFDAIVNGQAPPNGQAIGAVMPLGNLTTGSWDVFLIRDLGGLVGGIYFPAIAAVLQPEKDPFGIRGLEGALTRILAHELGHALSLPHVPCTVAGNLMAPGCQGSDRTRLSDGQIRAARAQAEAGPYSGGGSHG